MTPAAIFGIVIYKNENNFYLKLKLMKKFIYAFVLALVSSMAISSCTEEDVTPKNETDNGGGGAIIVGKS